VVVFATGNTFDGQGQLFTIWPDGSHRHLVAPDRIAHFALSPDAQRVVIEGAVTAVVGLDGSSYRALELTDIALGTEFFLWSSGGDRLIFRGTDEADPTRTGLYSIRAGDPNDLVNLAPGLGPLAVAPTGESILAFGDVVAREGHRDVANLFIVTGSGAFRRVNPEGTAILIEPGFGSAASWSPDGRYIAFAAFDTADDRDWEQSRSALYVADAAGTSVQRITGPEVGAGPTVRWSPRSEWVATTGTTGASGGIEEIWLVHPDGTEPHVITALAAPGTCCPEWSPDGTRLLGARLTVFDLDGMEIGRLASDPVSADGYVWVAPS